MKAARKEIETILERYSRHPQHLINLLQDVQAYNGLYTPFGHVTEGLDVLEKLQKGDTIESVTIVSKRNHPYKAIPLPPSR